MVRLGYPRIMIEAFITQLAESVGISKEQAEQVIAFLKQHADQLPAILGDDTIGSLANKLPGGLGGLGGLLGGSSDKS